MTHTDPQETRIEWHKQDAGRDVVVSVDGEAVRIAVALDPDASKPALESVLDELHRELERFCTADETAPPAQG